LVLASGSELVLGSGEGGVALEVAVTGGAVENGTEFIIARALDGASIVGKFADGAKSVTADDSQTFDIIYRENSGNAEVVLRRAGPPPPPRPEPSTYALIGATGTLLLALFRRRHQRARRHTGNAGL
jgi:hypothetical protein